MSWDEYLLKRKALEDTGSDGQDAVDPKELPAAKAVKWIYEILTVLDAKASALMRLNGVLIAAAAFFLAQLGASARLVLSGGIHPSLVVIAALLSAISIACCLFVVNVSWPFLGKATIQGTTWVFENEIAALSKTMHHRQNAYRAAWWVSLIATACFLSELSMQATHIVCAAVRS
jgi:hypothetical protein